MTLKPPSSTSTEPGPVRPTASAAEPSHGLAGAPAAPVPEQPAAGGPPGSQELYRPDRGKSGFLRSMSRAARHVFKGRKQRASEPPEAPPLPPRTATPPLTEAVPARPLRRVGHLPVRSMLTGRHAPPDPAQTPLSNQAVPARPLRRVGHLPVRSLLTGPQPEAAPAAVPAPSQTPASNEAPLRRTLRRVGHLPVRSLLSGREGAPAPSGAREPAPVEGTGEGPERPGEDRQRIPGPPFPIPARSSSLQQTGARPPAPPAFSPDSAEEPAPPHVPRREASTLTLASPDAGRPAIRLRAPTFQRPSPAAGDDAARELPAASGMPAGGPSPGSPLPAIPAAAENDSDASSDSGLFQIQPRSRAPESAPRSEPEAQPTPPVSLPAAAPESPTRPSDSGSDASLFQIQVQRRPGSEQGSAPHSPTQRGHHAVEGEMARRALLNLARTHAEGARHGGSQPDSPAASPRRAMFGTELFESPLQSQAGSRDSSRPPSLHRQRMALPDIVRQTTDEGRIPLYEPPGSQQRQFSVQLDTLDPRQSFFESALDPEMLRTGEFGPVVGRGTFSAVYRVDLPPGPDDRPAACAIKKVHTEHSMVGKHEAAMCNEIAKRLPHGRHDNLVQFLGASSIPGHVLLASEWIEGTHLGRVVQGASNFDPEQRLAFAKAVGRDIASGLAALEQVGLAQNDVKPDNVFLDKKTGRAKIGDFSNANLHGERMPMGHMFYTGPERCRALPDDADYRNSNKYALLLREFIRDEEMRRQAAAGQPAPDPDRLQPPETTGLSEQLVAALRQPDLRFVNPLSEKSDSFGLGQALHEMVLGRRFYASQIVEGDERGALRAEQPDSMKVMEVRAFFAAPRLALRGTIYRDEDQADPHLKAIGFYDFINCAMHPDVEQRWTPSQLLQHRFLTDDFPERDKVEQLFQKL